jgi:3-mercaptopyruvate sulfurtransferase SseA
MDRLRRTTVALTAAALIAVATLTPAGLAFAQGAAGRIGVGDLKKLHDAGKVVVLDVRSAAAYRDGHIAGALSVPLDTVVQRAAEFTGGRIVVTYCT